MSLVSKLNELLTKSEMDNNKNNQSIISSRLEKCVMSEDISQILFRLCDSDDIQKSLMGIHFSTIVVGKKNSLDDKILHLCKKYFNINDKTLQESSRAFIKRYTKIYKEKTFNEISTNLFDQIEKNLNYELDQFSIKESLENSIIINRLESQLEILGLIVPPFIKSSEVNHTGKSYENIIKIASQSADHSNRFIREMAFKLLNGFFSNDSSLREFQNYPSKKGKKITVLVNGLSDNWSQVRYAASVAARSFLKRKINLDDFSINLLPPICLNRYYSAQGVRNYSQETWELIVGRNGLEIVRNNISKFCEYYIKQARSDNHCVRESACYCICELSRKIDKETIRPFVVPLLETLLLCLKDQSWPVRDSATLAITEFALLLSNRALDPFIHRALEQFFENLGDEVPEARNNCIKSIERLVKSRKEYLKTIIKRSSDFLEKTNKSFLLTEEETEREKHSDKMTYSCGSLAPKLGKEGGNDTKNRLFAVRSVLFLLPKILTLCENDLINDEAITKLWRELSILAFERNYFGSLEIEKILWDCVNKALQFELIKERLLKATESEKKIKEFLRDQ